MALTVAAVLAGETSTSLEVKGETLNVTYKPGVFTLAALEEKMVIELLAESIVSWDLMVGTGKKATPYPTDLDSLKGLPQEFLLDVYRKIVRGEDEEEAGKSEGSFSDG